jgi:hypothetical protein
MPNRTIGPIALLILALATSFAFGQQPKQKRTKHPPISNAYKQELYTLRYKPQVGTTLYDAETVVTHHLENGVQFPIVSRAQLAFKNLSVDLNGDTWSFERYFTHLTTIDRDTTIKEIGAVNKVTRLKYSMIGGMLEREDVDTVVLSEDAQFLSYFFRAPRMLLPLPEQIVTYGATWEDAGIDTIHVPGGTFIYNSHYKYTFAGVKDTLGSIAAIITADQTGTFAGEQQKPGEERLIFHGPITGADTTYLNLFSGKVVLRISTAGIPVKVESQEGLSSSDILAVRSVYTVNNSNVRTNIRRH